VRTSTYMPMIENILLFTSLPRQRERGRGERGRETWINSRTEREAAFFSEEKPFYREHILPRTHSIEHTFCRERTLFSKADVL